MPRHSHDTHTRNQAGMSPDAVGFRKRAYMADSPDREAAFRQYVLPELDVLYRVGRSLTRNHADTEDLVQETIIRAYRAIDRFDGRHPRAWLKRPRGVAPTSRDSLAPCYESRERAAQMVASVQYRSRKVRAPQGKGAG